jgi:hypothetical protein
MMINANPVPVKKISNTVESDQHIVTKEIYLRLKNSWRKRDNMRRAQYGDNDSY